MVCKLYERVTKRSPRPYSPRLPFPLRSSPSLYPTLLSPLHLSPLFPRFLSPLRYLVVLDTHTVLHQHIAILPIHATLYGFHTLRGYLYIYIYIGLQVMPKDQYL